jgi:hypothetical protein
MRIRTLVILLLAAVAIVAAALMLRGQGGEVLAGWLSALPGH